MARMSKNVRLQINTQGFLNAQAGVAAQQAQIAHRDTKTFAQYAKQTIHK